MADVSRTPWPVLVWSKDGGPPVTTVGMRSTIDGTLRRLTPEDVGMLLLRLEEFGGGRARYSITTSELPEAPCPTNQ